MMDAYDIGNAIMTMWQRTSISFNDAAQVKKQYKHIPIYVKIDDEYIEITDVQLDNDHGIVLRIRDNNE